MGRLLIATKHEQIRNIVTQVGSYDICEIIGDKGLIADRVHRYNPETLFVIDGLSGEEDIIDVLIKVKLQKKELRIIFATGEIDMDNMLAVDSLARLTDYGIYDIYSTARLTKPLIKTMLTRVNTLADVKKYRKFKADSDNQSVLANDKKVNGYSNIVAVSSIKPGTGKSFTSTNIAMAIAKFGRAKMDGALPKVAIIEGDLQTLSVGTLLKLQDNRYNLKTALERIASIIDEDGQFTVDAYRQREVKDFVLKCFLPHPEVPNLYALTGSQLTLREMEFINPYQYFVLIKMVIDEFDLIVIDSNSSLEHRTTGPILQLAKTCFYVIDLDFCNVRSNLRYRQILEQLGLTHKIRYILNKEITPQLAEKFEEPLAYNSRSLETDGFELVAKFPMIDMSVIANRLYDGRPIILDNTRETLFARMEISKVANALWPMDNQFDLNNELKGYSKKKEGFFARLFGGFGKKKK